VDKEQLAARFDQGAKLFNAGEYFACHEAWEDVWRELKGENKIFVQALIQVAVGLYHASRGNERGAASLLKRGIRRLEKFAPEYAGVRAGALLADVAAWRTGVARPRLEYDRARMSRELIG
jgi:predicted metal-dependent hydrolase